MSVFPTRPLGEGRGHVRLAYLRILRVSHYAWHIASVQ